MLAFASLFAAVVPMVLFLWIVWLMDRYDREPIKLVAANFIWGAIGAIILAIVFSIVTSVMIGATDIMDTILIAPVVEELAKGMFLFWTVRRRQFDNVTDGIVYGMAIGLGFGMTENFLYFLSASSAGEWLVLVIIRTIFSAMMHAMATGTVGAFIGMTKFDYRRLKAPLRIAGFAIAMFMHFLWNFSVSMEHLPTAGLGMLFILGSLLVILILIQVSLLHEKRLIARELGEELETGLLPPEHLPFLCRIRSRRKPVWISHDIDKQLYVSLATKLAFRKAQSRLCNERDRPSYLAEVEELRGQIRTLLHPGVPAVLAAGAERTDPTAGGTRA